jgi:hypothetical protein
VDSAGSADDTAGSGAARARDRMAMVHRLFSNLKLILKLDKSAKCIRMGTNV